MLRLFPIKQLTLICVFLSCLTITSISQSVIIDYSAVSLGSSCNVFATSTLVQNYSHQTSFGFPYYSQTDAAINLQSRPVSNSSQAATQYAISYPFKQGYTYKISLYGKSTLGGANASLPSAAINLSNGNGGQNSITTCTGPETKSPTFDANYGHMAFTTSWSWSPNLWDGVATQNFNYLLIAGFPFQINYANDQSISLTHIRKIQITEIAPSPSFTLASDVSSIQCGITTPVTFTATNGANTTGVTGYTWNLGSANNGWLYNGSAAPATITTSATENTITLTPVCGSNLSNVSATVAANGVNYNTNSSTVSVTQPLLSINGNDAICSGGLLYSINNLPCNATVSWQVNPSGGVTIACPTCPQTAISKNIDGQVILTATVSNVCGQTVVLTKAIALGLPSMSDGKFTKNGQLFPLAIYNSTNTLCQSVQSIVTGTWQSANSVVWTGPGYSHPSVWHDYGFNNTTKVSTLQLHIYQTLGTGFWIATGTNGCGSTSYSVAFDAATCSADPCTYYLVSPNPSTNGDIVITSKPPPIECPPIEPLIDQVNIYDQNGNLIQTKMNSKTTNTNLRMSTTRKGLVIVEIKSGMHTERHKIIVQ